MQSRSRLLIQAIPSLRVQRLPANFITLRTVSSDASTQTTHSSRDSRGPRRNSRQGSPGLWNSLLKETSGRSCTLSYVEKQARWNEKITGTRNPTKDVFFKNLPSFISNTAIISTFPAIQTISFRDHQEQSCAVRFSSVEEAEKAVNAINSADEFPFPIPKTPNFEYRVDFRAPVRARYLESVEREPMSTEVFVSHYQGTEEALKEKLGPYVPAGHTLQIRYGPRGQMWLDMGSKDAVQAACKGLSGASYTCEFSLLVSPGNPPKPEDSETPI